MGEQSRSSDMAASHAWFTRTHFSTTICYRPGSCVFDRTNQHIQEPQTEKRLNTIWPPSREDFSFPALQADHSSPTSYSSNVLQFCPAEFCVDFPSSFSYSPSSLSSSSFNYSRWSFSSSDSSIRSPSRVPSYSSCISPTSSPTSPKTSVSASDTCMSGIQRKLSWSQLLSTSGDAKISAVLSEELWMVDMSELLLGERFACGNRSRLYKGIYKGNHVAVKVIRLPDDDNHVLADRLNQMFMQEVTALSCLQHCANVVKFFGACKKPPVLCVITEYLSGGSLRSFLRKREGKVLPEAQIVHMALEIALGMEHLHMKDIIHRDLKSENLVLAEDGSVKIVDLGVSCFHTKSGRPRNKADDMGTYRWMAPELLYQKPHNGKVDVFSFGIVLWELITTRVPYENMGAAQAAFCVLHKEARPPIPSDCPSPLADLMRSCWSKEADDRPEFWEIVSRLTAYERKLARAAADGG